MLKYCSAPIMNKFTMSINELLTTPLDHRSAAHASDGKPVSVSSSKYPLSDTAVEATLWKKFNYTRQ